MNRKLKLALERVTPETQLAYAQGHLPANLVIALSYLTLYEQAHLKYEPDPDDPNHSLKVGLLDNLGNAIVVSDDRQPYIQAVIDIFLEDQETYRSKMRLKQWLSN